MEVAVLIGLHLHAALLPLQGAETAIHLVETVYLTVVLAITEWRHLKVTAVLCLPQLVTLAVQIAMNVQVEQVQINASLANKDTT